MIGLGLKLLGLGKFLKDFFLQNWKWLVPLAAVIAGFFWTKEYYYTQGREETRTEWEKKVEKETLKNEKLTNQLVDNNKMVGEIFQKDKEERNSKEVTHTSKIETIIKDNPVYTQCVVDKAILEEQNSIKNLGPKL